MRLIVTLLPIIFITCPTWSQNFSIHIDPGDFNNSQEVNTVYANHANSLYILDDSRFDTIIVDVDNGKVLDEGYGRYKLMPSKLGKTNVMVTVKFTNGQIVKKSKTFEVIAYPKLEIRVKTNNILSDGTIEFQIYSGDKNLTKEFIVGYYEFSILDSSSQILFETPAGGSLILNMLNYKNQIHIQKHQTLRIGPIRLLWNKYNLPVYTEPVKFIIK